MHFNWVLFSKGGKGGVYSYIHNLWHYKGKENKSGPEIKFYKEPA